MTKGEGEKGGCFELSVLPNSDVALLVWAGPITLADRNANAERMATFCDQHGVSKIIIDGRQQESMTDIVDSFEFAKSVPNSMGGLRIAVVHSPGDEVLPFIETVAYNRGSSTRAFVSVDEARAWLGTFD
ncbi:MAG: hypothetical protein QNJ00_14480 [Woeseiaceae bacterium]|nr:hypothetical protein [Woeseiaceae bacterium]